MTEDARRVVKDTLKGDRTEMDDVVAAFLNLAGVIDADREDSAEARKNDRDINETKHDLINKRVAGVNKLAIAGATTIFGAMLAALLAAWAK